MALNPAMLGEGITAARSGFGNAEEKLTACLSGAEEAQAMVKRISCDVADAQNSWWNDGQFHLNLFFPWSFWQSHAVAGNMGLTSLDGRLLQIARTVWRRDLILGFLIGTYRHVISVPGRLHLTGIAQP